MFRTIRFWQLLGLALVVWLGMNLGTARAQYYSYYRGPGFSQQVRIYPHVGVQQYSFRYNPYVTYNYGPYYGYNPGLYYRPAPVYYAPTYQYRYYATPFGYRYQYQYGYRPQFVGGFY